MKSGWRVRREQARTHERVRHDDFSFMAPLLGPSGRPSGASGQVAKTQQIRGLVQVVRVGQAPQPVLEKNTDSSFAESIPRRFVAASFSHGHLNCLDHLDHLDHLDQASKSATFSGPGGSAVCGPRGPTTRSRNGDRCRACGERMAWPGPAGVILADGTAECRACTDAEIARLHAAAARALAGVVATSDEGELLTADEP